MRQSEPYRTAVAAARCAIAFIAAAVAGLFLAPTTAWCSNTPDETPARSETVTIERIPPERDSGQGYRLVYHVDVPIDTFWNFKIDFDNDFVLENKYIRDHRLVVQTGRTAVTENRYTFGPDVVFRWQTTLDHDRRRLEFVLLNPEECRQRYQYGSIQLESEDGGTRVTQRAYFDFQGAALWAFYPWQGGMKAFLTYTARWEQITALRLKERYGDPFRRSR